MGAQVLEFPTSLSFSTCLSLSLPLSSSCISVPMEAHDQPANCTSGSTGDLEMFVEGMFGSCLFAASVGRSYLFGHSSS